MKKTAIMAAVLLGVTLSGIVYLEFMAVKPAQPSTGVHPADIGHEHTPPPVKGATTATDPSIQNSPIGSPPPVEERNYNLSPEEIQAAIANMESSPNYLKSLEAARIEAIAKGIGPGKESQARPIPDDSAIEASINRNYKDLFDKLNLSEATQSEFELLLLARTRVLMGLGAAVASLPNKRTKISVVGPPYFDLGYQKNIQTLLSVNIAQNQDEIVNAATAEVESAIRSQLGDGLYNVYTTYRDTLWIKQSIIGNLDRQLPDGEEMLKAAQEERLIQLVNQLNPNHDMAKNCLPASVLEQAKTFLTPGQYSVLLHMSEGTAANAAAVAEALKQLN